MRLLRPLKSVRIVLFDPHYTGYPMVKEAKHQIASGLLGRCVKFMSSTRKGGCRRSWKAGQTQAAMAHGPVEMGKVGAMGDIGTHAFNLAEYVSGETITEVCAQLNIVVEGRALDDDGAVMFKTASGATGVLMATQVAAGEENNLKVRVFGEKGGLCWEQKEQQYIDDDAAGHRCKCCALEARAPLNLA